MRWLERARWTETASASSVSTSGVPRPSAKRQTLLWAAGTVLGLAIAMSSAVAIEMYLRTIGYSGDSLAISESFTLMTLAALGLIASGLYLRRLPMLIAAGITVGAALYGLFGLNLLFRISVDNYTIFWMLATAVAIQVLF
jgi:hypothetical protein